MARNARLSYGADSDLDPNIIALINRKIESQVEGLIDDRVQRRQLWGPTFKQEGISNLTLPDADYTIPSPEYGKRTLVFGGTLTAGRIVRLPPISSAWWIVRNNTAQPLTMLAWPNGLEGPTIESGNVEIVYTDGITVWRVTGPTAEKQFTGEWRFSDLISGPVGVGFFRVNNSTFATSDQVIINKETNDGHDLSLFFGSMIPGDQIYFQDKDDATKWARYEITEAGLLVDDDWGFLANVIGSGAMIANNQVCTVRLITGVGGGGGGSGASPGGSPTQLQYQVNSTTFGGVAGSSVSLANVGLGGTLNVASGIKSILVDPVGQAFPYMQLDRGGADLINGDVTGGLVFKGRRSSGASIQTGYLRSYWSDDFGPTIELGIETGAARFAVAETATIKAATMISGTKYFQVEQGGLRTSEGVAGAILYQDGAPLYLKALEIGAEHHVLKVTDIGGGVLRPRWGVASSAGGVPEGIATELQSRDPSGTVFKRVAGSTVSGGDIGLAGNLTFNGADVTRSITFNRTGADTADGNVVGQLLFNGMAGGSSTPYGFIRSLREDSAGGQAIDIGVDPFQRMVISATLGALVLSGTTFIRVQPTGIRLSGGAQGSLFYQDGSPLFFTPLPLGGNNTFLRSDTVRPVWTTLTMAHLGGVLPISQGGTGLAITTPGDPVDGALLIGSGGAFALSTLTAGLNVTINNTAGHITINATAGAATQRLDQIFDPLANTDLLMGNFTLDLEFTPTAASNPFLIQSGVDNIAHSGALVWVRTTGTSSVMNPFRVTADLNHGFVVTQTGVGVGPALGMTPAARFHVEGSVRFDLGGDLKGDLLYRSADLGPLTALHTTGAATGWVVTLASTGTPIWQALPAAGTVRLDQVQSPTAATNWNMAGWQVRYRYDGAVPGSVLSTGGGVLIDSTSNSASQGILLHVRNTYSDDNAARLLLCQVGSSTTYPLVVTHTGQVGMGLLPDVFNYRLYIGPMAPDTNAVVISGNVKYDTLGQGTNATGDMLYRGTTGLLTRKGIGFAGQYLRVTSGIPEWAYIDLSNDSFNGFLQVVDGGTGQITAPSGKILIGNGTSYGLGNITSGGGLSILYTGGNIQITAVGGSVNDSLNTILNPTANTNLSMGGFQARFRWDGTVPGTTLSSGGGVLIDSTTTSAGQGILLHLRNTYSDDNAARLLLCQIGNAVDFPLAVTHIGAVGMGGVPTDAGSATFRLQVFAPSSGALNALYTSGQVRFAIPGMSDNSLYYRASGGNLAGIPAAVTAGQVAMSDGSTWAARSITVVGGSVTYTGGVLQLTTPGGTGGTPNGLNQIQWNSGGSFAGVANSLVTTGGLVTLGEQSNTPGNTLLTLQKSGAAGADIGNGHLIGRILFQGRLGSMQDFGVLEGLYNTTPLRTLRLGQGILAAGNAYRVIALKDNGEVGMQVSTGAAITELKLDGTGIILTPGNGAFSSNGTYFRNSSGYIVTTAAGNSAQYFKTASSGGVPAWATIQPSDIAAGAFTDGFRITFNPNATNAGLNVGTHTADPSTGTSTIGDIYYNSSTNKFRAYQGASPAWTDMIGAGGSLSIDGGGTELLRRTSSSSLQTISGTSVSGADITFGGQLAITHGVTINQASLALTHTITGSNTLTNADYATVIKYTHNHAGNANDGRRGMTLYWNMQQAGTQTVGKRDTIFEIYSDTQFGTYTSYRLTGLKLNPDFTATVNDWIGIHVTSVNSTFRVGIQVDNGGGSVVIGAGGTLAASSTQGFLYIPSSGSSQSTPTSFGGPVALYYDTATNQIKVYNSGWKSTATLL
jgi:hypothetical protein